VLSFMNEHHIRRSLDGAQHSNRINYFGAWGNINRHPPDSEPVGPDLPLMVHGGLAQEAAFAVPMVTLAGIVWLARPPR
jgi:hypothetical protein